MSTQISLEKSIADLNFNFEYVKKAIRYEDLDLQCSINLTKNILSVHGLKEVTIESYYSGVATNTDSRKTIALEAISKGIAALTLALIAGIVGIILWMTGKKSSGSGSSSGAPTTVVAKEVKEKNIKKVAEIKEMVSVKKELITQINSPLSSSSANIAVTSNKPAIAPTTPIAPKAPVVSQEPVAHAAPDTSSTQAVNKQSDELKNTSPIVDEISKESKDWFTRHKEIFLKNADNREAALLKKYFFKKIDLKGGIEKLEYKSHSPLLNAYIHDISGVIDLNGIIKLMERMSTVHNSALRLRQTVLSDLEKFENTSALQDIYSNGMFINKRFSFDKKEELFSFCRIADEKIKRLNEQEVYDFLRYGGLRQHVIYAEAKQLSRPDNDIKDTYSIEMKMASNKDYKKGQTEFTIALPSTENVEKVLNMLSKFNEDSDYAGQLESKTSHVNKTIGSVNGFLNKLKNQIEDVNKDIENKKFEGETLKRATYWLRASNVMILGIEKILEFCSKIDKIMINESHELTTFITDYSCYSYEVQKAVNESVNLSNESLFSMSDKKSNLSILNW